MKWGNKKGILMTIFFNTYLHKNNALVKTKGILKRNMKVAL